MADATFYTVKGPRGVYFAVRNHETAKVWTERTEHAAEDQARDEGLNLVASVQIDHHHLLDLMLPQNVPAPEPESSSSSDAPTRVTVRVASGLSRLLRRLRRHDNPAGSQASR